MKTVVYIAKGKKAWKIVANGRCPDNCDAVTATGRKKTTDEICGVERNKKEAFEDALIYADNR
ncbi:MAG: hypothetical protein KAV87_49930 [Desulfobacteraceae bacterium]|nr:hypothetical protein [Desulfobacteraceae bacterium]